VSQPIRSKFDMNVSSHMRFVLRRAICLLEVQNQVKKTKKKLKFCQIFATPSRFRSLWLNIVVVISRLATDLHLIWHKRAPYITLLKQMRAILEKFKNQVTTVKTQQNEKPNKISHFFAPAVTFYFCSL